MVVEEEEEEEEEEEAGMGRHDMSIHYLPTPRARSER